MRLLREGLLMKELALVLMSGMMLSTAVAAPVVLGPEAAVQEDPRQVYPRILGFRPAEGQVVDLNPPRMSWPWDPDVLPTAWHTGDRRFTLQISSAADFARFAHRSIRSGT